MKWNEKCLNTCQRCSSETAASLSLFLVLLFMNNQGKSFQCASSTIVLTVLERNINAVCAQQPEEGCQDSEWPRSCKSRLCQLMEESNQCFFLHSNNYFFPQLRLKPLQKKHQPRLRSFRVLIGWPSSSVLLSKRLTLVTIAHPVTSKATASLSSLAQPVKSIKTKNLN